MKLTLTCLFVLTLAVTESKAQRTQATQMDVAARECHRMLVGFYDEEITYFQTWGSDKSMDTLAKIETCAKDSYPQLTKRDLAVAVVISNWLNNFTSADLISTMSARNQELQSKLDQLMRPKASAANEMEITIETLPSGYTRTLNGGSQDRCTADGPESMKCEKFVPNLGYWPDSELTAMLARVKTSYGSTPYLIGCPPAANCAPLVPGEYSAVMSGSDGLVISGLVTEGKTDDSPRHGIYTILSR